MSPENEAALEVEAGSTVIVETCDCFENQIIRSDQDFGTLDWERINPATGPIYVKGAEPGDILVVRIQDIEFEAQGVMTTGPNLGVLGDELKENVIRMISIRDGYAVFSDDIQLPLRPMIGVIGTAPKENAVPCGTPGDHGGNMDCTRITVGATLLLPVNVPGALFALGDLHATMGDGEVAVCGVETAGRVTVQLDVIKGKEWPLPMIVNDDVVLTIASAVTLDDAVTEATKRMVHWLADEFGMDVAEATFLCSAAGDLRVCQVVDPLRTARFEIPRWILQKRGFTGA
ncbi:acetamidase/formamidase family protein [Alicyclobacillus dauci]|uniref:Acetamidase/formamidase family protein n=1 Tax=Alicyclobacillus dauci TaxID=1475485 RepID=A0ABY6ZAJ3_9BACL|nr:acetamidase/formamidase family protein [Alicyclobacillus dauci]WAH39176.1 acetamidase/formamidase family protein [Alicyclobacillus dauci]